MANFDSDYVSVINATTDTVNPKPVPVGISPLHLFGDLSVSDHIYVANYGSDYVSVIDPTTNAVKKEITVGVCPVHIFGDLSVSDAIYVANFDSDIVSVIDPTTSAGEIFHNCWGNSCAYIWRLIRLRIPFMWPILVQAPYL